MNNKLSEFRAKKGISQKQVASQIGITTSHYGMIELGTRNPSLIIAHKLALYFKVSIEEIFFAK